MTTIKTLYHPKFEPKESWLRAMLLFYDTVHSIVPEDAEYTPSPGISMLCEKVQEAFVPLVPTEKDLDYDWDNYFALTGVLRELSGQDEGEGDRIDAQQDWSEGPPRLDLGGGVKVHTDKMADMLAMDLIDFGLAERTDDPRWLRVDRRVANLVLSMLADRMAQNQPGIIYTSSDQESSFAVAAKGELQRGKLWNVEATLASAILTVEIPAELAHLSLDRYLNIRKRYEERREVFRLAMQEMQTLYFNPSLKNPDELRKQMQDVVGKFSRQTQALREQRFGRQVHSWAPIALGGIVSIAAAAIGVPEVSVGAAGVNITLRALKNAQGARIPQTNVAKAQALLVELDRNIHWNRNWLGRVFSW
jgi:hypothetical protein